MRDELKNSILAGLNPEQQQAVQLVEGPLLVLAGAGSGKTKTIIHRCAWLINICQVPPWRILVVTFTNKAAAELRDRLQAFGINPQLLWVGTFHSLCARILRLEAASLPFNADFSIYDAQDQQVVLKKVFNRLDIERRDFPLGAVQNIISQLKNKLIRPSDFFRHNPENAYTRTVYNIYEEYQRQLAANNALDFDDILLHTAWLLEENATVRQKYRDKFHYLMIDEYQDTNYAQFMLVRLIGEPRSNICVVGDDDQAIYSWRGADIRNILEFERDFPGVVKLRLERNYRSTGAILDAANSLISRNQDRHEKSLMAVRGPGVPPEMVVLDADREEAGWVASQISELKNRPAGMWGDNAVLYRTNAQSRLFESAFLEASIPYKVVGGVNFFQRKEIKDVLAYLRILVNPADNESLLRIINFPHRGIGDTTINRLINAAVARETSLWQVCRTVAELEELNAATKLKVQGFVAQIGALAGQNLGAVGTVNKVLDVFGLLREYEKSSDPQDISRAENLAEFVTAVGEFAEKYRGDEDDAEPGLSEFLQSLSLLTDLDSVPEGDDFVRLTTMHNAKGLEFTNVFAVGLEDELIPHRMSMDTPSGLEEERRLLYVALTRAKDRLFLSYARLRRTYEGQQTTTPSRFLSEIDPGLIHMEKNDFYATQAPRKAAPVKLFAPGTLHKGAQVEHNLYGRGVIINMDNNTPDATVTVSFKNGELKKIKAGFLKPI